MHETVRGRPDGALDERRPGSRPRWSRLRAVGGWASARPVLTCVLVAGAARLAFATGSFIANGSHLIGDELQYVQLATYVADGRGADAWFPAYGQTLYDATWAFVAPIAFLFKVFGPSRFIGQLWAAGFGVLVVALVTVLAARVADRRWALGVGLVAALLPSQVLWSSVFLRESMIWAALVVVAFALHHWAGGSTRQLVVGTTVLLVGLVVLGQLREQTFVVAAWALVPAVVLAGGRRLLLRSVVALAFTVFVPAVLGLGPAGYHLVQLAVPSLATTRQTLSLGADTGFTPTTILVPTTVAPTPAGPPGTAPPVTAPPGMIAVPGGDGNVYALDESVNGNLDAIPRGLVAVLLRPFPWEHSTSVAMGLAKLESLLWWVLYLLAAIGIVASGRRHRRVLAYPVLVLAMISGVAALTQGNLGTAFRHRGQLAWAVLICAAAGLQAIADRRSAVGADGGAPGSRPLRSIDAEGGDGESHVREVSHARTDH